MNNPKIMTQWEVIAEYKSRPQKSAEQYAAEIAQLAQYYSAGIMKEPETVKPGGLFANMPFFISTPEGIVTEDAEVVSIETATAPCCASGGQPMLPR